MTKAELIETLVNKTENLTKKQVETIVGIFFNSIKEALAAGDKVEIRGFGSFRVRVRKNRNGRNPKTGSLVNVPQKKVPFFKVGKELKEEVDI